MLSTVLFTTPQLNMIDHPLSSFSETLLPWLHACLCAHMCGIHVHIHICMCVHMHVETQGWRWVFSLINLHCAHFYRGPPLNPELSALAPVAHQLAPEISWVGLPLTGVTGSLLHFWLVFYLALGIRASLTFTSVWPLPGPIPYTFEGAYGPSSALFLSLLASSKNVSEETVT